AVCDHEPYRQIDHAVRILTAGRGEIGEVRIEVLLTFRTVVLRIRDHEITRTPQVEIAQVVQLPLGLLVPIGRVTTAWTPLPLVIATIGDDLWRGQVCNRGYPFGGIRPISTRTKHHFAFLVRMLEPKLYDTGSSKTIRKPGKDAIVSAIINGNVYAIWSRTSRSTCKRMGPGSTNSPSSMMPLKSQRQSRT